MYTAAQLAQHARDLAAAFGIRLLEDPDLKPEDAFALHLSILGTEIVGVACAPIIDETTYAVALHEIGHHLAPLGNLKAEWSAASKAARRPTSVRDWDLLIESEEAAWTYARYHALVWTEPMDVAVQGWALDSYRRDRAKFIAEMQAAQTVQRAQVAKFATRIQWA